MRWPHEGGLCGAHGILWRGLRGAQPVHTATALQPPPIDPHTGAVFAYVFGWCQYEVLLQLKALLEPFGLPRFSPDHWGASTRPLDPDVHSPDKRHTQKMERTHLTIWTRMQRLVRTTICCSQSMQMPDIVIGLFVHRYAFGRTV
jgi:insertion element IS1 protein InsB